MIHSHSFYEKGKANPNTLSGEDVEISIESKMLMFVTTPNGSLISFTLSTEKEEVIDRILPSDPNDPTNNGVSFENLPDDEPVQKVPKIIKHLIKKKDNE